MVSQAQVLVSIKMKKGIDLGYDPASLNHLFTGDIRWGVWSLVLEGNWHLGVIKSTEKVRQVETHTNRSFLVCVVSQPKALIPSLRCWELGGNKKG